MSDRDQRIAELREEFWDLEFDAPKPRAPHVVSRDTARMAEIKKTLAELGSDVGERPSGFPTRTV